MTRSIVMRRLSQKYKATEANAPRGRQLKVDLPEVAEYPRDLLAGAVPVAKAEADPTEEMVRRMVEAAYT